MPQRTPWYTRETIGETVGKGISDWNPTSRKNSGIQNNKICTAGRIWASLESQQGPTGHPGVNICWKRVDKMRGVFLRGRESNISPKYFVLQNFKDHVSKLASFRSKYYLQCLNKGNDGDAIWVGAVCAHVPSRGGCSQEESPPGKNWQHNIDDEICYHRWFLHRRGLSHVCCNLTAIHFAFVH